MQDPTLTHHIQFKILRDMLTRPTTRYSELKPPNLEANLFMYHLKQLIKLGLVEKHEGQYRLTRQGNRFADRATLDTMRIMVQPKIVAVIVLRRADGWLLMLERKHQPFLGYKGFPSGKIQFGETLQQAAKRELHEKTGLQDVPLRLRGNYVIRFLDGEEVINHIVSYVFYGELPAGFEIDHEVEHFKSYMAPEASFFHEPCFKGHQQILAYLERGEQLFIEACDFTSDF